MNPARKVPYEGPLDCHIYIVGEAPGATEEQQGRPFVGSSGAILDRLLLDSGIDRSSCRVGNVCRVRPDGNDFDTLDPTLVASELEALVEDIKSTSARVVLALGAKPLFYLCGKQGIGDWRGSVLWSDKIGKKVLPTYHPAAILRQFDYSPLALLDVKKCKEESAFPELRALRREHHIVETLSDALSSIRDYSQKPFAFDIETTRGETWITSIALADSASRSVVVPFQKGAQPVWSVDDEAQILEALRVCLENPSTKKITQNGQFDIGVLAYRYGINVQGLHFDTRAAFHCYMPELPKDLGTLCSIYTDQPFYKNTSKDGWDSFLRYNALDAMVTFEVYEKLSADLKAYGTSDFYHRYVHPRLMVLSGMELRGVLIDRELLEKTRAELEQQEQDALSQLREVVGYDINPNSPKQLKELFYGKMKLRARIRGGKETTNEEVLEELAAAHPSPVFDLVLRIRRCRKLRGTYLDNLVGEDGRAHASFSTGSRVSEEGKEVSSPETGRLSSSFSIITNSGTNLQNIPKGVCRGMFLPDPGYTLVECDLAQADARVVAYDSCDPAMIDVFETGKDIHRLTASMIFDIPYEQVGKDSPERVFSKTHVHAFNYRESVAAFARRSGKSKAEAARIMDKYFAKFPSIPKWHERIIKQLRETRTLTTAMGRKRKFFGRWGDPLFNSAIAFGPQSTVGDVASEAMCRLDRLFEEMEAAVLLQVHDSVVFQVKTEAWERDKKGSLRSLIDECFAIPLTLHGRTFTIPYECKSGPNWGEMRKEW